jgi:hypothetical protein
VVETGAATTCDDAIRQRPDEEVDESLIETFPASDPPSWVPLARSGCPRRGCATDDDPGKSRVAQWKRDRRRAHRSNKEKERVRVNPSANK